MRNAYGTEGGGDAEPRKNLGVRQMDGRRVRAQKATVMLAVLFAFAALLLYVGFNLNPERSAHETNTLARMGILEKTLLVLSKVWSHEGSGVQATSPSDGQVHVGNALLQKVTMLFGMGGYCCDESICSKYALEQCKQNQQASQQNQEASDIQNFLSSTSSSPVAVVGKGTEASKIGSFITNSGSNSQTSSSKMAAVAAGEGVQSSGAERAAAAMGLNVVRQQRPLRSYYAEQRRQAEEAAAQDADSDAPAPTVGLITNTPVQHQGALRAAEAFGIHLSNVGHGGAGAPATVGASAMEAQELSQPRTEELLELNFQPAARGAEASNGPGARMQKLEDVFSAPLTAAEGVVSSFAAPPSWSGNPRIGSAVGHVRGKESDGFVSSMDGRGVESDGYISKVEGRGKESDGYVTKVTGNGQIRSDYVTDIGAHAQQHDGYITNIGVHAQRSDGTVTTINGHAQRSTDMITNIQSRGVANKHGEVDWSNNLDANGQIYPRQTSGPYQDAWVHNIGSFEKGSGSAGALQTPDFNPNVKMPKNFGQWQAPEGWQDGRYDDKFSITVHPKCGVTPGFPCPHAEAHLTVEVFCPPYTAPEHGSVWYLGKQYFDATAKDTGDRKSLKVGSSDWPIAQAGDIPAGGEVQIECDIHYRLSEEGSETPRCLETGEFEKGKICEPIMCDAYQAPPHGVVVPEHPVMAGQDVTIYCDEGYDEYYGGGETVSRAPPGPKLKQADPWWDYDSWWYGPNQGKSKNLISMDAGPKAAQSTVQALGMRGRGGIPTKKIIDDKLSLINKKLSKLRQKQRAVKQEHLLSHQIMKMNPMQIDSMVESFVKSGSAPVSESSASSPPPRGTRRKLLSMPDDDGEVVPRDDTRRHKSPVCLDTGHFQRGILCKARPKPAMPPQAPPPGVTTPIPRGVYIVPLVCPSYIAPDHGSVWYKGREYRISTASGTPALEKVEITCHKHFRLSKMGSATPQCMRNGQWEVGKVCEPIYCGDYGELQYGFVSTHDYVRVGTRIKLRCQEWYKPVGYDQDATDEPMCLDSGKFEKGITCVPKPCPVDKPCTEAQRHANLMVKGIEPKVSKAKIRDWEESFKGGERMPWDYNPNAFDQEPRPWTLDLHIPSDGTSEGFV